AEDALRESEQRLRELSITDELTGLANRRHFYEVLETELERVKRYGGAASLALIDLDGFKEYNDRYGHVNADEVLKAFAAMLRSHLRKADRVFRYGGDEFAMILPHTSDEKAWQVLDRLRGRWDRSGREGLLMTADVNLSFSAGIVQLLKNAESADALVFLADASLYFAKSWGGHRTTLATEMNMPLPEVAGTGISAHVYALAATVDSRDPHTYGHSTRVAELTALIGKSIELTEQETVQLHSASLLHDIGKIGIPDSLLTTWRSLTADERRLMQKHSTEGAKIVGHVRGLTELVPSILHHHERYDGRGYPDGLKGEETPLYARIIAIADAYDTMTTKRLYRRAISRESALQELRKHAGTQFDPVLVDAFCRAMEREESAVSPGDVPGFRSPRGIGDAAR
ncbi:MAG: diguanylate cyclase, partial [Chloroflexi bacterium]|nr:diguanylate cyclase [Chloroflexota bacterium]